LKIAPEIAPETVQKILKKIFAKSPGLELAVFGTYGRERKLCGAE
jgi:hypothetical protein